MRFLLVNEFYPPEVASSGQHLSDLCEALVHAGHDVQVLCTQSRYAAGDARHATREWQNGVLVERVRGPRRGRGGLLRRVLTACCWHLLLGWRVLRAPACDVIVTLTSPPMVTLWGTLASRLRGCRHLAWLMDLHPDAAFELDLLPRRSPLGRSLEWLSCRMLRAADHIIVLGPFQRARVLEKGVARERISIVPIWNRGDEVQPAPKTGHPIRNQNRWQDRFVVLYSGNAGRAHAFDSVLEAAAYLRDRAPRILFAFVGGGALRPALEAEAAERGLTNIEWYGYRPRDEVSASLTSADLHLVTLRDRCAGVAVPSKTTAALASGRPIVYVGPEASEPALHLHASGAGITVATDDATGLAQALMEFASDPVRTAAMGRRGREYFDLNLEARISCQLFRVQLESLALGWPNSVIEEQTAAPRVAPAPLAPCTTPQEPDTCAAS